MADSISPHGLFIDPEGKVLRSRVTNIFHVGGAGGQFGPVEFTVATEAVGLIVLSFSAFADEVGGAGFDVEIDGAGVSLWSFFFNEAQVHHTLPTGFVSFNAEGTGLSPDVALDPGTHELFVFPNTASGFINDGDRLHGVTLEFP